MRNSLTQLLKAWFPRCIDDKHGGFLCDFDYRWRQSGSQLKMLEYQARTTRLLAAVAAVPGLESYQEIATHGFHYLRDVMWDHKYQGWFRILDRAGNPLEAGSKHVHGTSYGVSACVAYYKLTSDSESLQLAKRALAWLEDVAHDGDHGGYFPAYRREGTRILSCSGSPIPNAVRDHMGTPFGFKDQNSSTDMLDALVDLSDVWEDAALCERMKEVFCIVRDRIIVAPGAVHTYFHPDWTPVPEFARYASGLHAANKLARSLRNPCFAADSRARQVIDSLIDNILRHGWDKARGGFFYGGSTFGRTYMEDFAVHLAGKYWWTQAEGLTALLRMALSYPGHDADYMGRFTELWAYINHYVVDSRYGGWLWVARDSQKFGRRPPKATMWKDASHEVHALLDCMQLLESGA